MDANTLKTILQEVLSAQSSNAAQSAPKVSTPKLDLTKLNSSNYEDWTRKMKYALQFQKRLLPSSSWLDNQQVAGKIFKCFK